MHSLKLALEQCLQTGSTSALAAMLLLPSLLSAQEHSVTLRGIVFDSTTGLGVPTTAVHLDQDPVPARTDTLGQFWLAGLSIGTHTLTLAKPGYGPRVFTITLNENGRDTVDVGPFPLAVSGAITATISGNVLDSKTGEPVIASGVYVNGQLVCLSSDSGGFTTGRVEIPPGFNVLVFKRIGYEPFHARLWAVESHTDLDLAVHLHPLPIHIPTVIVEASYLREFYQRRRNAFGYRITRQDIEEQNPLYVSDMLRMTPGILVRPSRFGGYGVWGTCGSLGVYIDGFPLMIGSSEELDWLVHPNDVAGIEVYPRFVGVPVQYRTMGSTCGVILVWTRR